MSEINLFEYAAKNKLRFPAKNGLLTAEDLWDLPLTSTNHANLNDVAKEVNRQLKESSEESFVGVRSDKSTKLENQLDLVKYVIAFKQDERQKASESAANAVRRQQVKEALEAKRTDSLKNMSEEDLLKELTLLG